MNRNTALFIGVAAFVLLFFKQEVALNLSIFSLLVWALIFLLTEKKYHNKTFWWLTAALFVSIGGFAWFGDFASFVPLFFTLILFIVKAFYPKLNILAFPFVMFISGGSSLVRILMLKSWIKLHENARTDFWKKMIAYFVVPLFFAGIFLLLYSGVSDRFAAYFRFDWDLENALIISVLTVVGFFFMFNFVHLFVPRFLIKENFKLSDEFSLTKNKRFGSFSLGNQAFQRRSGEITLIILNLILAFFIFTYASESIQNIRPTESYSSEVHERVYVLIASIIVAVAVIMVFFHSPANFGREGKLLRLLSYVWMTLNASLVIIAMLKTGEYVHHYGLTFKRIGVYVFLGLCIVGLIVTSYKLMFIKTNVYLLNRMAWIVFVTTVIGFNINWSWVVTKYNISYQQKPDVNYLRSLDYNKGLMYNTFGDEFNRDGDFNNISSIIKHQRNKPLLSSILYYQFLNIKSHEKE